MRKYLNKNKGTKRRIKRWQSSVKRKKMKSPRERRKLIQNPSKSRNRRNQIQKVAAMKKIDDLKKRWQKKKKS